MTSESNQPNDWPGFVQALQRALLVASEPMADPELIEAGVAVADAARPSPEVPFDREAAEIAKALHGELHQALLMHRERAALASLSSQQRGRAGAYGDRAGADVPGMFVDDHG